MNVYTGQFKQVEMYIANDLMVCSVARNDPPWFKGPSFKILAPEQNLLMSYHQGMSFGRFAVRYIDYLKHVDFEPVLKAFDFLCSNSSGIVLCCYEPKTQFCHRHLLANFLNTNYQLGVTEF